MCFSECSETYIFMCRCVKGRPFRVLIEPGLPSYVSDLGRAPSRLVGEEASQTVSVSSS